MIPTGDDGHIRTALTYMPPEKVLQWAQATICPNINARDIRRIAKSIKGRRSIGTARDASVGSIGRDTALTDSGALAKRIDAYIAKLATLNRCKDAEIKGAFGWR